MTQTIRKPKLMRFATFITALALMFTFFGVMPEGALRVSAVEEFTYTDDNGTWSYYLLADDNAVLTEFEKSDSLSENLEIPSTVNGHTVVRSNVYFDGNTTIKSVVIPDTIKTVWSTFERCTNLTTVTFSKNQNSIPSRMFMDCKSLTTLNNFSDNGSITEIGSYAFYNCSSLEKVTLPCNLTSFSGEQVFMLCKNLENIIFPEGITSIPSYTARFCNSLEYVYIPSSVTSISSNAFYLDSFYVPKIYGYSGTAAEEYATEHSIEFVSLDSYVSAM
ncbi:MAG: leucine-rich repeat domain-containing protein, partial [Ruminococcus sp.]|nr:leucine-rich repeat domain-containing protein [Ruminococcus sp.]